MTRKQIRRERGRGGGRRGGGRERCISESTVQTTDTEKQTVPAKAFPTQMNGRGLEAPAQPNTLNICTLIVFHCLGHSRPSHSQAFKIPPSPSNRSLTSIKKRQKPHHDALHHLSSLSANLFILILLDATPTEKHLMAALSLSYFSLATRLRDVWFM